MKKISFFEAEPELYEKTFGYRDFSTQVNFLNELFKQNNAKNILDIASGHSPQGRLLAKKGYSISGVDLSESLLELGRKRAKSEKTKMKFYKRDMSNFSLGKFDAAYIMFNSILHLNSKRKLNSHFKSVNKNLRKKGIYVIDVSQSPFEKPFEKHKLDRKIGGIRSVITYTPLSKKNLIAEFQTDTHHKDKKYSDKFKVLMFLPIKILKDLASKNGFEILDIYSDFKFNKNKESNPIRYIAVLRKIK